MNWLNLFKPPKPKKTFFAWQIELTTRCPLRCKMCIREECGDWQNGDMDIDNFRRLLPYLHNVETVVLEGWGESLLHKDLLEIMQLVKGQGSRAGFVTSGKALDRDYILGLIDAGVNFIGFSLAGSSAAMHQSIRVNSDFEALMESINIVSEIKIHKNLKRPKLHIVYLMLRNNISEVPALMGLAKKLRIEEVVLINLIHVTNKWQDGQRVFRCNAAADFGSECHAESVSASPEVSEQVMNGEIKNRIPAFQGMTGKQLENDRHHDRDYENLLKETEANARKFGIKLRRPSLSPVDVSVCEENPLRNLYISVNGEVSPCVYLYPPVSSPFKRIFCGKGHRLEKVSFGNIFIEPFETIWNNKQYVEFRRRFEFRKKAAGEMRSYFFEIEKFKGFEMTPLPDPPEQCKTCHKMLGV